MQTLLSKVVDSRDTGCFMAQTMVDQKPLDVISSGREDCTNDNQRGYNMSDTHFPTWRIWYLGVPVWGSSQNGGWQLERAPGQMGTDKFDGDYL